MSGATNYKSLGSTVHLLSSNGKVLYAYNLGSVAAVNALDYGRFVGRRLAEYKLVDRFRRGVNLVVRTGP